MKKKNSIKPENVATRKHADIFKEHSPKWLSAINYLNPITNTNLPSETAMQLLSDTIKSIDKEILLQAEKTGDNSAVLREVFNAFKNAFIKRIIQALTKLYEVGYAKKFTQKIIIKSFINFDESQREIFVFLYIDGFRIHQICYLVRATKPVVLKKLYSCRIAIDAFINKKYKHHELSETTYNFFIRYFENDTTPEEEIKFFSEISNSSALKRQFNDEINLRNFLDKPELLDFYTKTSNLPTKEDLKSIQNNYEVVFKLKRAKSATF